MFFAIRYASSLVEALTALEMAAYDDLVTIEEVSDYVDRHPSYTGIAQARQACLLGSENRWSPQESAMAVGWEVEAGFPRPLANQPLFDLRGNHVGTPDLLDPDAGVIGEYDGVTHLQVRSRSRDLTRESDYRDLGLEVVRLVSGERARLTGRLSGAYARARAARATQEGGRAWTIDLPPWWVPTFTVEQRRALSGVERDIWLRYRSA